MRFKVDANELASRKRWTAATKTAVSNAERKARSVLDAAKRRGPSGFDPSNASGYDQGISAANDDYLNREHDNQQLLMRKQDADLDDISVSIQRLGQVGLTIGEELETQGKMIDELEQDVDGTNSRLAAAQRKMNQVLKKAGMKGQMCIIVILTAILIILFLIAFM
jgi:syntaxin 6